MFFHFLACLSGHNNLGGRNTQKANNPIQIPFPCIFNWKHSLQTARLKERSMNAISRQHRLVSSAAAPAQKTADEQFQILPYLLVGCTNQSKQNKRVPSCFYYTSRMDGDLKGTNNMHERNCSFLMQELTTCSVHQLFTVLSEIMGTFLSFMVTFERNPT